MNINMTDKYTTRSGLPVRVLCVDKVGTSYPVVALAKDHDDFEHVNSYASDGRYYANGNDELDLIPVPKVKTPQEQVEELLAIARADRKREWFTGMPPKVGWYPCNRTENLEFIAFFDGNCFSWWLNMYDQNFKYIKFKHKPSKQIKWTTPWWKEEWNQEYWSKQ